MPVRVVCCLFVRCTMILKPMHSLCYGFLPVACGLGLLSLSEYEASSTTYNAARSFTYTLRRVFKRFSSTHALFDRERISLFFFDLTSLVIAVVAVGAGQGHIYCPSGSGSIWRCSRFDYESTNRPYREIPHITQPPLPRLWRTWDDSE